ncbi:MAG: hypothetical protein VB674_02525, partial [Vicinamibacterales bacterium]
IDCQRFLESVSEFTRLHAVKLYRLSLELPDAMPSLPCLDHEAMLHEGISPHAAAYVEDFETGGLHEVVCVPARRRIEIDVVSTAGEHSVESHDLLVGQLKERFPGYQVVVNGPSWLRGDRRVARACRSQVPLRDVLVGADFENLERSLEQLRTVGALMEKQSRVASWSVRTVTGPMLAVAGVISYQVLGTLTSALGEPWVQGLQYCVVGSLGGLFLYLGLKAVHLTEMANRVWKRYSEYSLILKDRSRQRRRVTAQSTNDDGILKKSAN